MRPTGEPRTVKLGGGQTVPYPEPGSPLATQIGKANLRTGTRAEERVRRELHRLGLRYRKDVLLRAQDVRTHADLVFRSVRVAVFIDGCFWHMCPEHFQMPKSNLEYWRPKLQGNVARDRRVDAALEDDGWTVVRIWEHVPVPAAARVVVNVLDRSSHAAAGRASRRLGAG